MNKSRKTGRPGIVLVYRRGAIIPHFQFAGRLVPVAECTMATFGYDGASPGEDFSVAITTTSRRPT